MTSLFRENGRWYKGNLHTHTTLSDGRLTPEECVSLYKSKGYDFLSITDHWKVSSNCFQNGMLLLSGGEWDMGPIENTGCVHVVGIGMQQGAGSFKGGSPYPAETSRRHSFCRRGGDSGASGMVAHPAGTCLWAERNCGH